MTLARRALDPGWTPSARDLAPLLALLETSDEPAPIERALLRRAAEVAALVVPALDRATARGKVPLLRLMGRLERAGHDRVAMIAAARAALADDAPAVRRQAARLLGGVREEPAAVAAALAELLGREARPDVRRAVIDALGKLGGPAAEAALAAAPDPEPATAARLERARITVGRAGHRDAPSRIGLDVPLPRGLALHLHTRRGLAPLVVEELAAVRPTFVDSSRVALRGGPLAPAAASRLMLRLGVPLPIVPRDDLAATIVATLLAPAPRAVLAGLTDGPIRWRLAWADGGHHRGLTFAIAGAVAAAAPELVNDPSHATWQVRVALDPLAVELEPRRFDDDRFAYRVAEVPAASHPTIAAALALLSLRGVEAPARDVVWDPFVGSGLELIERARRAPVAALHGTDLDDGALAAARANLLAAGVDATLVEADATVHRVAGLTCAISNPPLGRRLARGTARALLARFVDHVAPQLGAGGRLCWITPMPRDTDARAAANGLEAIARYPVDLGGFDGELQLWRRSAATGRQRGQRREEDRGGQLSRGSRPPRRRR
jgi:hypothetical protein